MLILRPFWHTLIEQAWQKRNIIWLMGVRRVGKTSLCLVLPDTEYFDCERPRVRQLFDDAVLAIKVSRRKHRTHKMRSAVRYDLL